MADQTIVTPTTLPIEEATVRYCFASQLSESFRISSFQTCRKICMISLLQGDICCFFPQDSIPSFEKN
jgi:hypothetical protein